jgi:hypothetical protein
MELDVGVIVHGDPQNTLRLSQENKVVFFIRYDVVGFVLAKLG